MEEYEQQRGGAGGRNVNNTGGGAGGRNVNNIEGGAGRRNVNNTGGGAGERNVNDGEELEEVNNRGEELEGGT